MNMEMSYRGLNLLMRLEGKRLKAYQDNVGVWTIGYGHITDVKEGQEIDEEQAAEFLVEDMKAVEGCISNSVEVDLNQNQFDALACFVFNTAAHECEKFSKSTMCKLLNVGNYKAAAQQFDRWNKERDRKTGELVVSNGLSIRRKAERELFESVSA